MALVNAAHQRVAALGLAWQDFAENLDDVVRRQQVDFLMMHGAALSDEQHGQQNHGHMVMPCPPAERLIVGQTALAFGVL